MVDLVAMPKRTLVSWTWSINTSQRKVQQRRSLGQTCIFHVSMILQHYVLEGAAGFRPHSNSGGKVEPAGKAEKRVRFSESFTMGNMQSHNATKTSS